MAEVDDHVELLFFDTFSHEINEDINLDLVQFPKPVYITEIRIIPLGARVQADFPGGVRLGATNPSKFGIEFFVNDLGNLGGASTFESLGNLEYNQNDCIHLECQGDKIPTDGLVLRGWYTTITLAVYGTLTRNLAEQIASPPPIAEPIIEEVAVVPVVAIPVEETIVKEKPPEWREEVVVAPIVIPDPVPFAVEVYREPPPFEEAFEQAPYPEEPFYPAVTVSAEQIPRDHEKRTSRRKSHSSERSGSRNRTYSHSDSNEREYNLRQKREWSRSPEYRQHRRIRRDRSREVEHTEREHKWPRTPPSQIESPRRPRSPDHHGCFSDVPDDVEFKHRQKPSKSSVQPVRFSAEPPSEPPPEVEEIKESQSMEDDTLSQGEQFEPILSDDEIGDDDNDEQENEEIEMEETEFEYAIKIFDPFKMPINRYDINISDVCDKEIESMKKIFRKYEQQTKVESCKSFLTSTCDEKENFVYVSEQFIALLHQISMSPFKARNAIMEGCFRNQEENLKLASNILRVGLDFDCALAQRLPGYKIRHIKIGARLAELLGVSEHLFQYLIGVANHDPFRNLLDLYEKEYMALSIKLMLLKAVHSLLDTKAGCKFFLNSKVNGYQRLISLLQSNPLSRAKFALSSIIKKLHLFESLQSIHDFVTNHFVLQKYTLDMDVETLEFALKDVIKASSTDTLSVQQPKRFLPVSKKFEIVKDASAYKSWTSMLQSFFKIHTLAESLLLLISNKQCLPLFVVNTTYTLLEILVRSSFGLDYMIDDCFETIQLMVKCLLTTDGSLFGEGVEGDQKFGEDDAELKEATSKEPIRVFTKCQKLGIEIAFTLQTRYHMDAITHIDDDSDLLVDHLHALYSQTCSNPGRSFTVDTIGMGSNMFPFLQLIEKERKIQTQRQQDTPGYKYKSSVLSYAVDLVDCCVRHSNNLDFLMEHGQVLLDLVKNHEIFEPSVSAVLQEMAVYLKVLEVVSNFGYDDVTPLSEVIKRSIEYITTFPGDLIMALRILKYLGIPDERMNSESETKELKHRFVILQFYSSDGVLTLLSILEKLNTYFEQPGLHSPTLMTIQAVHTCQIILPTLQILREMFMFVIQCRDTNFKDLTLIEHLMNTYCLMHYFPEMSQAYEEAEKIKLEIINILLSFTQPSSKDEDSVHKSLWTQTIHEVVKSIMSGPSTFIPGLQAFAEILPLPLPVPALESLPDHDTQKLLRYRNLWSAHLHPESSILAELIQNIAPSSFPQLSDLLIRVCLQLADLAPNMTLLVSKTVTDMIINECSNSSGCATLALARLLKFLGQLTAYASVKISSLSILSGRLCDYFIQILTNFDQTDVHLACQQNIHRILENFFDSEISMIAPNSTGSLELNLACALPSKELIPGMINAIFTNLLNTDIAGGVAIAASRNLIILSEHDITFFHLRNTLLAKKDQYQQWLKKLIDAHIAGSHQAVLDTVVIFLRTLIYIDESSADSTIPNRTLKFSIPELADVIGLTDDSDSHPLKKMKDFLEKEKDVERNEAFLHDVTSLLLIFENVESMENTERSVVAEPNLPQAEGIVTQYQSRPVFTILEPHEDNALNTDAQLSAPYWLEPLRLETLPEIITESERVPCDLSDMVSNCLPPETNLTAECKRVLHLSASPQSSRERTATAPCFRTRRVEVEPSTGRPEKKIFVSPMRGRGFPRAPPSRGDLFRSRPPNTSRPPSLHVDDFLALETCGAQPTGPTGYNKLSREIISIRGSRVGRSRGTRITTVPSSTSYRTGSPSTWSLVSVDSSVPPPPPQHFRTATSEPVVNAHFSSDPHYAQPHFGGVPVRSRGRARARTFLR